ncbi:uncharacterized protein LOC117566463 [Drosophila albomicans]|uniref:Uncharacterized protein LOC117566463 n=1 Tax=Drosophila albomicans TaxID=7291 RepID=A0A9C6W993_DROAB|nr:uncharacterized protein LOC117566463 [Drosophila albomicans]
MIQPKKSLLLKPSCLLMTIITTNLLKLHCQQLVHLLMKIQAMPQLFRQQLVHLLMIQPKKSLLLKPSCLPMTIITTNLLKLHCQQLVHLLMKIQAMPQLFRQQLVHLLMIQPKKSLLLKPSRLLMTIITTNLLKLHCQQLLHHPMKIQAMHNSFVNNWYIFSNDTTKEESTSEHSLSSDDYLRRHLLKLHCQQL